MQSPETKNEKINTNNNNFKYKTAMCRHYEEKGYCCLYDKCHFAHSPQELRNPNDPLPPGILSPVRPISNFKTQLCKFYQKGFCRNRDDCAYAHGADDMRGMPVVPADQYKARPIVPPPPTLLSPVSYSAVPIGKQPQSSAPQPSPFIPMYLVPLVSPNNHLMIIIQNLYQVFPGQSSVAKQLQTAQYFLIHGNEKAAEEVINAIIQDPNRSEAQVEKSKKICTNAMYLTSIKGGYHHPPLPSNSGSSGQDSNLSGYGSSGTPFARFYSTSASMSSN